MYKKFNDINLLKSKFPIVEYLAQLGITPVCKKSSYALYHAPYRVDRNPSCIVYRNSNTFLDLSTRQKGDIIELVKLMNCCDFKRAVEHLIKNSGATTFTPNYSYHKPSMINILETININSWQLKKYLKERGISKHTADKYCREVRYVMGDNIYYAIGFLNDKNGYELRSKNYKGCTSKYITTIEENPSSGEYLIFEGFFDFLTQRELCPEIKVNAIILNSVCNLSCAIEKLEKIKPESIVIFGDTDIEGQKVYKKIYDIYGEKAVDFSLEYKEHNCKDFNEYIVKIKTS